MYFYIIYLFLCDHIWYKFYYQQINKMLNLNFLHNYNKKLKKKNYISEISYILLQKENYFP